MRIDWKDEMDCLCKERVLGPFEIILRYLPRGRFNEETHEKPQKAQSYTEYYSLSELPWNTRQK
jgi:hypothetical protein